MILKGSQRGGGGQLALHLLRQDENDHVTVHDIRGFVAEDLTGALKEAYAISRGTKCRQYLFSLSLSPPETERVPVSAFENAVAEIEDRLGLAGQPRAIVFHEKLGRRHAHCVWSRINADAMKAINISHYKLKLREVSRQLYIEHGWQMPRGLVNSDERNPFNFSREEWQQALRTKRDPRVIKQIFQDCWAISDGLAAFKNALEARGFYLALGDRRGFVAIDWQNEIYSVSRWVGARAKDVRAKLGDPDQLPTVKKLCTTLAQKIDDKHRAFASEVRAEFETARIGLLEKRKRLVEHQRHERELLRGAQAAQRDEEARVRAARFRRGLKGLWDRITGKHTVLRRQNEADLAKANRRDADEIQSLVDRHLAERRALQQQLKMVRSRYEQDSKLFERAPKRAPGAAQPDRRRRRQQPQPG